MSGRSADVDWVVSEPADFQGYDFLTTDLVAVRTECGLPGDERRSEEGGAVTGGGDEPTLRRETRGERCDPPATTGALCFPNAITRPLAQASWGSSASRYSTCVPCDTFSPLLWLRFKGALSVTVVPEMDSTRAS